MPPFQAERTSGYSVFSVVQTSEPRKTPKALKRDDHAAN